MKLWPSKRVWKWIRRGTAALLVLVVLAGLGFEFWRQHRIELGDMQVDIAQKRVEDRLYTYPYETFDDYRNSKIIGENGNDRFVGHFLVECHNVGVDSPNDPMEDLRQYRAGNIDSAPTDEEFLEWLKLTRGLADELAALQTFDCIVLDPRNSAHEFRSHSISTLFFFAITQIDALSDRVSVLLRFDRTEQAVLEYRALRDVALKMQNWASIPDSLYGAALANMARGTHQELAGNGLLNADDYRRISELKYNPGKQVFDICLGHMLRLRDDGLTAIYRPDKPSKYTPDTFAWVNPSNYEHWESDELIANTVGWHLEREGLAIWIQYSLNCLDAIESGQPIPEMPFTLLFDPTLLNWHDRHGQLVRPAPRIEMFDFINWFRVKELEGETIEEIRNSVGKHEYVEFEWSATACTVRYTPTEDTWALLEETENDSVPYRDEFYKQYPPVVLKFID